MWESPYYIQGTLHAQVRYRSSRLVEVDARGQEPVEQIGGVEETEQGESRVHLGSRCPREHLCGIFFFWRVGVSAQPWLSWNLLCRPC